MNNDTLYSDDISAYIASHPVFKSLDDSTLNILRQGLEWIHLPQGQVLVRQGDIEKSLYAVIDGRLTLHTQTPDGTTFEIGEAVAGRRVG
ncbi:MAG: Crp/Fnr family transcriptional regulator, partial [Anaerolineae bacterium]|nr:Crp/Fnr family transcriptional regulator [Anaerolineae bacterium]